MSTISVTTVTSPDANTPLIIKSANTNGGQIVLNAANNDIQVLGNLRLTSTIVGDGSGLTFPSSNVANAAFGVANASYTFGNTVYAAVNSAFTVANSGYGVANAAFGKANSALQNTSTTFSGTLTVSPGTLGITTGLYVLGGDVTAARSSSTGAYYFGSDNSARYLYHDGSNYQFGNVGYVYTPNNFRAPIFYDNDNTGYYFNGNGTSNINGLTTEGFTKLGTTVAAGTPNSSDLTANAHTMMSGSGGNYLAFGQYNSTGSYAQWIQSSYVTPTTAVYNLVLQPLGGNVGIGGTPATKLTLGSGTITVKNSSGDSSGLTIYQDTSDTSRIFNYYSGPLTFGTGNSERLRIDSAGNVGINTTSPSSYSMLTIAGGAITSGTVTSTSGSVMLRGYYGSGAISVWGTEYSSGGPMMGYGVKPSTSAAASFISSSASTLTRGAYTIAGNEHVWYSGASQTVSEDSAVTVTEKMRLTAGGNLGIGSNAPFQKLDVVGLINSTDSAATQRSYIGWKSGSGYGYTGLHLINMDNSALVLGTNNTARAAIDVNGQFSMNSGFGSVTNVYGMRCWVNFAGSSGTASGSGGLSSVTRNATGSYTINLATASPDSAFSLSGSCRAGDSLGNAPVSTVEQSSAVGFGTSTAPIWTASVNNGGARVVFDPGVVTVMIVR